MADDRPPPLLAQARPEAILPLHSSSRGCSIRRLPPATQSCAVELIRLSLAFESSAAGGRRGVPAARAGRRRPARPADGAAAVHLSLAGAARPSGPAPRLALAHVVHAEGGSPPRPKVRSPSPPVPPALRSEQPPQDPIEVDDGCMIVRLNPDGDSAEAFFFEAAPGQTDAWAGALQRRRPRRSPAAAAPAPRGDAPPRERELERGPAPASAASASVSVASSLTMSPTESPATTAATTASSPPFSPGTALALGLAPDSSSSPTQSASASASTPDAGPAGSPPPAPPPPPPPPDAEALAENFAALYIVAEEYDARAQEALQPELQLVPAGPPGDYSMELALGRPASAGHSERSLRFLDFADMPATYDELMQKTKQAQSVLPSLPPLRPARAPYGEPSAPPVPAVVFQTDHGQDAPLLDGRLYDEVDAIFSSIDAGQQRNQRLWILDPTSPEQPPSEASAGTPAGAGAVFDAAALTDSDAGRTPPQLPPLPHWTPPPWPAHLRQSPPVPRVSLLGLAAAAAEEPQGSPVDIVRAVEEAYGQVEAGSRSAVDRLASLLADPRVLDSPLMTTLGGREAYQRALHGVRRAARSAAASDAVVHAMELEIVSRSFRWRDAERAHRVVANCVDFCAALGIEPIMVVNDMLLIPPKTYHKLAESCAEVACTLLACENVAPRPVRTRRPRGQVNEQPALMCEALYLRAAVAFIEQRPEDSVEPLFEAWALALRRGLSPSRIEARCMRFLASVHLYLEKFELADHFLSRMYWYTETDEDRMVEVDAIMSEFHRAGHAKEWDRAARLVHHAYARLCAFDVPPRQKIVRILAVSKQT
eukprot:tig00000190_g13857.t1